MKKMIMTLMMVLSMTIGANAQRLDNTYMEARILTDYMADELSLNSWQREKAYQMNLDYLNGIGSYRDIDAHLDAPQQSAEEHPQCCSVEALQEGKLLLPSNQLETRRIRTQYLR